MGARDCAWFDLEIGDPGIGASAKSATDSLKSNQGWKKGDALRQVSTYFGRQISSLADLDTQRLWAYDYDAYNLPDCDVSYSRTAINTIISRIFAPQKPKPVVLTQGADYKTRLQARKRSKFLEGQFQESQGSFPTIYALGMQIGWDACVFGGLVKIVPNLALEKVEVQRLFIWNWFFDECDAKNGFPTQCYEKRTVDRAVLKAECKAGDYTCGKQGDQWIDDATDAEDSDYRYKGAEHRNVEVWECYVKAQGDTPGRRVILLGERVLDDREWTRDSFPYVPLFFHRSPIGVRALNPIDFARIPQMEANYYRRMMRENVTALAGGYIFVPDTSTDLTKMVANDAVKIIPFNPNLGVPVFSMPQAYNPQVREMFEACKQEVLDAFNLSGFAVNGEVQPGTTSGIAVRNINQVQDMQFLSPAAAYEQWFVDVGKQMLWCVEDLQRAGITPSSFLPSTHGFIERIDWEAIGVGDKSLYTVQVRAGNDNADTLSGRQQFVAELFQMGRIDAPTYQRLSQNPDTEAYQNREDGQYNWVERLICDILDSEGQKDIDPPDELMDLVAATMQMTKAYHEVSAWPDTPEDVRRAMRQWIANCVELINRASAPTQPPSDPSLQSPPAGGPSSPPPSPIVPPPAGPNLGMN